MWDTQHNNVDRDCFKILIFPVTSKTRNQHWTESDAYLEVTRLFQEVGCARNRLQFLTVQRKLKQFVLTQVHGWTVSQPWALGIWWKRCFSATTTNLAKPRSHQHGEICGIASYGAHERRIKPKFQPSTMVLNCFTLVVSLGTSNFLSIATLSVFEDAVIKWKIKGRSPTERDMCQGLTEFS